MPFHFKEISLKLLLSLNIILVNEHNFTLHFKATVILSSIDNMEFQPKLQISLCNIGLYKKTKFLCGHLSPFFAPGAAL